MHLPMDLSAFRLLLLQTKHAESLYSNAEYYNAYLMFMVSLAVFLLFLWSLRGLSTLFELRTFVTLERSMRGLS